MKKCPKCGELIGDDASKCFNCFYVFNGTQRINALMSDDEKKNIQESIKNNNDYYEYDVVVVEALPSGEINVSRVKDVLYKHAQDGWRLANSFSNEMGVSSFSQNHSSMLTGKKSADSISATISQIILIFERCISRYNK